MGFFSKREKKKKIVRPHWRGIAEDRLRELGASQDKCTEWAGRALDYQAQLLKEQMAHAHDLAMHEETAKQLAQVTADYMILRRRVVEDTEAVLRELQGPEGDREVMCPGCGGCGDEYKGEPDGPACHHCKGEGCVSAEIAAVQEATP